MLKHGDMKNKKKMKNISTFYIQFRCKKLNLNMQIYHPGIICKKLSYIAKKNQNFMQYILPIKKVSYT